MADIPFVRGNNVTVRMVSSGAEVTVHFKDWSLDHVMDEVEDAVGGEDADRYDVVHKGWKFTGNIYQRDEKALTAYVQYIQNNMSGAAPFAMGAGMKIIRRDGQRANFVLKEVTWSGFGVSMPGRTQAIGQKFTLRARYMDPGKAT